MIIKGTFENGHIRILSGIEQLPEGTEVLITPITLDSEANCDLENLRKFKVVMQRIALRILWLVILGSIKLHRSIVTS